MILPKGIWRQLERLPGNGAGVWLAPGAVGFFSLNSVVGAGGIVSKGSRSNDNALQNGNSTLSASASPQTQYRCFAETPRNNNQPPSEAIAATSVTCHNAFTTKFSAKSLKAFTVRSLRLWRPGLWLRN